MNCERLLIRGVMIAYALFVLAAPVTAAPSLSGSTGMIHIPTADSLRFGQFSAGYYYWHENAAAVAAVGLPRGVEISAALQRSWNVTKTIGQLHRSPRRP